jgi:hypothetical protein
MTVATARLLNALRTCRNEHGIGCRDGEALREAQLQGLLTSSYWPSFHWTITEKGFEFLSQEQPAEVDA